jgi:carboxymethylenebutenolidase
MLSPHLPFEALMKFLRTCAVLAFAVLLATRTVHAAPETVTFKSGDETVKALLYLPAGAGPHPAIVLVHEWWGVTDWVKAQAQDFADHGYVALVPDLYRGQSTSDPQVAHELMRGLPEDRAVRDLVAAAGYLATRHDVRNDRIGTVGWCMGGGYALQLALADHAIRAVAINYGALATDKAAVTAMPAAVLGNFGALDRGITPADVQQFEATLKSAGKAPNIKIYPDAGHGFENPGNKDGYRAADTVDAHERMLSFFGDTLKSQK